MLVLSHPTGNRNVRAVLMGLARTGNLAHYYTTIATDPDSFWLKLLPHSIRNEFLRRSYSLPLQKLITEPFPELLRIIMPRIGLGKFTKGEKGWASIDAVCKSLDRKVADNLGKPATQRQLTAVYGYEDTAFYTFKKAKELGLKCVYDLPIAYWEKGRKLMLEEAERLPAWAATFGAGISDSAAKLERKTRELEMADIIICPGQFVIDSLPKWAVDKDRVIAPFGSPELKDTRSYKKIEKDRSAPLRILFAGSMTQRKGLGDLFAAFRLLKSKNVQLVVMGATMSTMRFYRGEFPDFVYEPCRPHHQVLELMQTCDILCLPSIVEGRALVMQEAMSQGLPLIITPNTGGEDLIEEGVTGYQVPIRNPKLIAEKINWFLENRSAIPEMGRMAKNHARQYTWNHYQEKILESLKGLIMQPDLVFNQ